MLIRCVHGYFFFEESAVGQLSRLASLLSLSLAPNKDHFTFTDLLNAPDHSLKNSTYLGATAIKNFEGKPWEVMKANGLVYNFQTGKVVTLTSITQRVVLNQSNNYFFSNGLILPGSLTDGGKRVTDYSAWYSFADSSFRYSEVTLV